MVLEELYTLEMCKEVCDNEPTCGGFDYYDHIAACSVSFGRFCHVQPAQCTSTTYVRSGTCLEPKIGTKAQLVLGGVDPNKVHDLCFNQGFVWEYKGYSTCVGASPLVSELWCDNVNMVCAGSDGNRFGTLQEQAALLANALQNEDNLFSHTDCPIYTEDVPGNFAYNNLSNYNNGTANFREPQEEPLDCIGNWTELSQCDVTCGFGTRTREYYILQNATSVYVNNRTEYWSNTTEDDITYRGNSTFGGYYLSGHACDFPHGYIETQNCTNNNTICEVDCIGSWSDWSICSERCDGGVQTKEFKYNRSEAFGGQPCAYNNGETISRECNTDACPQTCIASWSEFSECKSCGGGTRTKTYTIFEYQDDCAYKNGTIDVEDCSQQPACLPEPIDCVGNFTDFGACPVTCGTGKVTREYQIVEQGNGYGVNCPHGHGYTETALCHLDPCPVDCVTEWGDWSANDTFCADGVQSRTRVIVSQPSYGGTECDTSDWIEYTETDVQSCPTECHGIWSEWSGCSVTCGEDGTQYRTYTVSSGGNYLVCSNDDTEVEDQVCNNGPCDVDCEGQWEIGTCSQTCGDGTRISTYRIIEYESGNGASCSVLDGSHVTEACNVRDCPATGCTDATASNYDENAEIDDGSCLSGVVRSNLLGFYKTVGLNAPIDFGGHIGTLTVADVALSESGYYLRDGAYVSTPTFAAEESSGLSLIFEATEGVVVTIFGRIFVYENGAFNFLGYDAVATNPVIIEIRDDYLRLGDKTFALSQSESIDLAGEIVFSYSGPYGGYIYCIQIADGIQTDESITNNRDRCENIDCGQIFDALTCINSGCEVLDNDQCAALCAPFCYASFLDDSLCQEDCNNSACGFDGGFCCGGDHQVCCDVSTGFSPCDNPDNICNQNNECVLATLSPSVSSPTDSPSKSPSVSLPTKSPSKKPTPSDPTMSPSWNPTRSPTSSAPSVAPTRQPSPEIPTTSPSTSPSNIPSVVPTNLPSKSPTISPSASPSLSPSVIPSTSPSKSPTVQSCAIAFSQGKTCTGIDEPVINGICSTGTCDFTRGDYANCCTPFRLVTISVTGEYIGYAHFTLYPNGEMSALESIPSTFVFTKTSSIDLETVVAVDTDLWTYCEVEGAPCWSVWHVEAGKGETCGQKIQQLLAFMNEELAFKSVALQYPVCAVCNPSLNDFRNKLAICVYSFTKF